MGNPLFQVRIGVVVELRRFLLFIRVLYRSQQHRKGQQNCLENLFLGQCRSLHFLLCYN